MSDFSCKQKSCYSDITCTLGYIDKRDCEHFLHGCLLKNLVPTGFRLEDHRSIYRREDVVREARKSSIDRKLDDVLIL